MSRYHTAFPVRSLPGGASMAAPTLAALGAAAALRKQIVPGDVVHAMRSMGWSVAAALMDRWLNGGAWIVPETIRKGQGDLGKLGAAQVDETTVTMNWALNFERARTAQAELEQQALNPVGVAQLKRRLSAAGWTSGAFTLGRRGMSARDLNAQCQVNYRSFGGMLDTVDAMYGALGRGTMKAGVVGRVEPGATAASRPVFKVDALGIYLQDSYDFTDDGWTSQPLGIWSRSRCLNKAESVAYMTSEIARWTVYRDFTYLDNRSFDKWRKSAHSGGDFIIFSDVLWVTPPVQVIPL